MNPRLKLKNNIEQKGNKLFTSRSKFVHEDPESLLFKSLHDFEDIVKEITHEKPILIERKKTYDSNPDDFDVDHEEKHWQNTYLVPFEQNDKPAHILCYVHSSSYYMKEQRELNVYMDCQNIHPNQLDKELKQYNIRVIKKNGKWVSE